MNNYNVDIANKIFTYVKHGADITPSIKEIYANSLIFIGDEQQIYVPVIDTYVGVGKTKYNELSKNILWVPSIGAYSITTAYGNNISSGEYSVSIGENNVSSGKNSFTQGNNNLAAGKNSFASGDNTKALKENSHSEGSFSTTYSNGSHADGYFCETHGNYSHAQGHSSSANGDYSLASGISVVTENINESSFGRYNKSNTSNSQYGNKNNTTFSIGIGSSEIRKNAFEIMENGNAYLINVGNYNGSNISSATTLQDVINRHLQSGVEVNTGNHVINNISVNPINGDISYTYHNLSGSDSGNFLTGYTQTADGKISVSKGIFETTPHEVNGDYVITYAYINSGGKLHYNYRNLSGSDSGNFLTGYTQTKDGKISVSKGTFTTTGHSKTSEQNYVVTYTYIDSTGKIHYDYRDLSGTDSGDFLTGYTQTKDGKISVSKGTFTYAGTDKENTAQSHVITDINISSTGKISYNYRNLSGSDSGNFLTGFSQTNDGKVTVSKGTFTNSNIDEGIHNLVTYISTNPHKVVTYTYIDSTGKIHYTYDNIYVDPQNDFKYHDLGITQVTYQGNENFVYAITGISTTNGNATSHTVAYQISGLPTKKYVDDQFKANDALRYCGTVTPSANPNGTITFTHVTDPHPGHSNPDYDAGAVYKVNGTGYIFSERVSSGDMMISYSDSNEARTSSLIGWNVINQNIDLRTLPQTEAYNGSTSTTSDKVLTNTYLTNDGSLSYTAHSLSVNNKTKTFSSASQVNNDSAQDLLRVGTGKGLKVLTDVSLNQNGLTTELNASYTYLYTNQNHHAGSVSNNSGFIYSVSLSNSGELSGQTKSFTNTKTNSSSSHVVTNVNLSTDGGFSYSTKDLSVTSGSSTNDVTSGVIVKLTQAGDGQISYAYRDLSVSSGSAKTATTITNSTKLNVLTGITADKSGKISYAYSQLNTTHSTNTGTPQDPIELTTSNTNVLTGVSISADGVLSYTYTPVSIGDSDHAGTSAGLDSVKLSGANSGVLTNLYVDSSDGNKLTYVITDASSNKEQSSGFIYKIVQNTYGIVTATGRNFSSTGTAATSTLVDSFSSKRFITGVNLSSSGALTYTYDDVTFGITHRIKNVSSNNTIYLAGVTDSTNNAISYQYFNTNTYTTNGAFYTSSAIIGGDLSIKGNTTIGDASTDTVTLNAATITIRNNTKFTNLSNLWGTI